MVLLQVLYCVLAGAGLGDSVEPSKPAVSGGEGDAVTLTCSYNTDYSGGIYLYWYRHYPNRAPQYILWRGAKSYSKLNDTRFSSQADDSSTVLNFTALELADTAVYLCALSVTHPAAFDFQRLMLLADLWRGLLPLCKTTYFEMTRGPPFICSSSAQESSTYLKSYSHLSLSENIKGMSLNQEIS
uniref:Ig-like domain-containing protein n=1 Tax=Chrysemys picta bellii TaxID=8478 RepID=A0A8C3ICK8_CHRPI